MESSHLWPFQIQSHDNLGICHGCSPPQEGPNHSLDNGLVLPHHQGEELPLLPLKDGSLKTSREAILNELDYHRKDVAGVVEERDLPQETSALPIL